MVTYLKSLNSSLYQLLETDPRVYLIGEDLLDPYGGAFKVTKGLSTAFPGRVLGTPISEASFVGVATGMALRGLRPVVEIMFGDFLVLAMNQLLNHACKYAGMYAQDVSVPMVIRTPMGGGRGYGPTHSQTLEKFFLGIPGLNIISPSLFHDPGKQLELIVHECTCPTLFIEHKLLYAKELRPGNRWNDWHIQRRDDSVFHTVIASNDAFESADVTVLTYGGACEYVLDACKELLYEYELATELIVMSNLKKLSLSVIGESLSRTGKLAIIEEGTRTCGVGAEAATTIQEKHFSFLKKPIFRIASFDFPIPASRQLENNIIINRSMIINEITRLCGINST